MFALCLEDPMHTVETETISQAIALSSDLVKKLEELSPSSYSLRWSGYSVTLSEVLQNDWTNFTAGSRYDHTSSITTLAFEICTVYVSYVPIRSFKKTSHYFSCKDPGRTV